MIETVYILTIKKIEMECNSRDEVKVFSSFEKAMKVFKEEQKKEWQWFMEKAEQEQEEVETRGKQSKINGTAEWYISDDNPVSANETCCWIEIRKQPLL